MYVNWSSLSFSKIPSFSLMGKLSHVPSVVLSILKNIDKTQLYTLLSLLFSTGTTLHPFPIALVFTCRVETENYFQLWFRLIYSRTFSILQFHGREELRHQCLIVSHMFYVAVWLREIFKLFLSFGMSKWVNFTFQLSYSRC